MQSWMPLHILFCIIQTAQNIKLLLMKCSFSWQHRMQLKWLSSKLALDCRGISRVKWQLTRRRSQPLQRQRWWQSLVSKTTRVNWGIGKKSSSRSFVRVNWWRNCEASSTACQTFYSELQAPKFTLPLQQLENLYLVELTQNVTNFTNYRPSLSITINCKYFCRAPRVPTDALDRIWSLRARRCASSQLQFTTVTTSSRAYTNYKQHCGMFYENEFSPFI